MRSFKKGSQNFIGASTTQPEIYSPSRTSYQNRVLNTTENSKNKKRAEQIVSLHEQFEDLKKKIKQVQNKNQKIIQKIHRQCNFKKKNPQTYDVQDDNSTPIVYYEKKDKFEISQGSGISFDESNKSDQSQYQFKQRKKSQHRTNIQVNRHPSKNFTQSIQYTRNQTKPEVKQRPKISNSRFEDNILNSQQRIPDFMQNENRKFQVAASQTFQHLKQYGKRSVQLTSYPAQSQTHMGYSGISAPNSQYNINFYQLQQSLKIQKEKTMFLQEQLKNKQLQILNLRKNYNKLANQNENLAMILQDELQNFMQNIVKKGMFQIQKNLRRQQNRIKNLIINVKDQYQQLKSSRIIKQHQLRRSNSRSKKDISPAHNTSVYSAITPLQQVKIPRPGSSNSSTNIQPTNLSQSKVQETILKKNKQFQQIVAKYEQMIGSKKIDITKLQLTINSLTNKNDVLTNELNQKQKQIKQMKVKIDQLEKLMSQTYNQMPIFKNQGSIAQGQKLKRRASSNQSNLLEDIYNFTQIDKNKQSQFKSKYLQSSQQLKKKNQIIQKLELNIKNLQKQLRNLQGQNLNQKKLINQNSNQINSQKIQKQRNQEAIKKQLNEQFKSQLNQKSQINNDLQAKLSNIERRLIEKDCEINTLHNKIKKVESINDINSKKLLQYEKLLNHYNQNNTSVDYQNSDFGMLLLQKSVCYDQGIQQTSSKKNSNSQKSAQKTIVIQISQLENYEKQLENLNQQILSLTKKLKITQNSQKQKNSQILRIKQENEYLNHEKQKLIRTNNSLQQKIKDFQTQIKQRASYYSQQQQRSNNQQTDQISKHQKSVYSEVSQPEPLQKMRKNASTLNNNQIYSSSDAKNRKMIQQNNFSLQNQKTKKHLEDQIVILKTKNSQILKQISQLKQQHLQLSRQNISLKKDNQYLQDTLSDREQKYQKFRRQAEELKISVNQINQNLRKKQEQLKKQRQQNCQKIIQLQKQWHQFEEEITKNNQNQENKNLQNSEILKVSRYNISESSILMSSTLHNRTSQYLQEQNEYLTIKLKEAEATVQMQNQMEQKVLAEYKKNVEKLKLQIKQKVKQNDNLRKQIDMAKDKIRRFEVMNEGRLNSQRKNLSASRVAESRNSQSKRKPSSSDKQSNQEGQDHLIDEFASYNEDNNNLSLISGKANQQQGELLYPYEKIIELQLQLKESKDINRKLQQMQEELFKQIKFKQEEKNELIKMIEDKNFKIQQLQEIVELKQMNLLHSSNLGSNLLGSHISSSNPKSTNKNIYNSVSQRQSMRSQSSLRYSGISHSRLAPHELNQINQSNLRASEQRFQVQLTEIGSEMLDRSYMTNISEFFQREEFPYEKAQLKRNQQIKFFQKTASYIKSLKQAINEKNKKINILEKKIQMLKQNHHGPISQQLQNKYQVSTGYRDRQNQIQVQFQDVFKDYQSVQLQRKKVNHKQLCKSLKHELKLSIQQNNVLSIQIQALKTELQKAQEQEDNLVMMKDIQKNQIKQLRVEMKNQQKYFKDLLDRQKKKIQQSESVHNLATIKQLFIKTIESFIGLDDQKLKTKRQQKRKQIQDFFKIFSSLAGIEEKVKNSLLDSIKKLKVNSVSMSQNRGSSSEKVHS